MSQDENFDLEATCRELSREKSRLGCEVRTLRYELDETRLKLEEKTAEYESLKRKMDSSTHSTLPQHHFKGECQDHSHVTLLCRIQAAESRKTVVEKEIEAVLHGKAEIIREMDEMKRKHEDQVLQFTREIQSMDQLLTKERSHFEIKYNEIKGVVESQHAYILKLEEALKKKDKEREAWAAEIHGQIKHFMTDALEAITAGEEQRHAIVNKKTEVAEELKETQKRLESFKDEMNSYRQTVASIFTKATGILMGHMNSLSEINLDSSVEEITVIENKEVTPSQEFTVNHELHYKDEAEQFLDKFSTSINTCISQNVYMKQIERLEKRIQQLEKSRQIENKSHAEQMETLRKKCKEYGRIIRKLTSGKSESKQIKSIDVEQPPSVNDEQKLNTTISGVQNTSTDEKLKWYQLKENHNFFEKILKEIDDTLSDELRS